MEQLHKQLVDALQQYKGRTDYEALHAEFHESTHVSAVEVVFEQLMGYVSSETVAKLLMWPSFIDFKNMVLSQDVKGLTLYVQALTYGGLIPMSEAGSVLTYLGTVHPEINTPAPITVAFDYYKLRERYGEAALGMPNFIPLEDFTLAMMEVNDGS